MRILSEGLTDIGHHRGHNEDSLSLDRSQSLFIVADGVGGQPAGEVASRLVTNQLPPILSDLRRQGTLEPCKLLSKAVRNVNRLLLETAAEKPEWQGMATTIVAVWYRPGEISFANVGDSRAYLIREQKMVQITEDHTVLAEQRRLGVAEDELSHGMSHILTRCLGLNTNFEVSAGSMPVRDGDRILLCSDGLTDSLSEDVIRSVILSTRTPGEGCRMLVELANRNGGRDNITVLLIYFYKATLKTKFIDLLFRRN